MRDALSLLDRCIAFYMNEKLTYWKVLKALGEADTEVFRRLTESVAAGDAAAALRLFGMEIADGVEVSQFISDYIWFLRGLMLTASVPGETVLEIMDMPPEQLPEMQELAVMTGTDTVVRFIYLLPSCRTE